MDILLAYNIIFISHFNVDPSVWCVYIVEQSIIDTLTYCGKDYVLHDYHFYVAFGRNQRNYWIVCQGKTLQAKSKMRK